MPPASTSPWLSRIPDTQRYPTLSGDLTADVAVVGGGIAGVATAYFLAKAGTRPILLEATRLGTGETGLTTALLTSSIDQPFSVLRARYGDDHIRTVRQLGEEAIALIEHIVTEEQLTCDFARRDAFVVALDRGGLPHLEREADALRAAGAAPTPLRENELGAVGMLCIPAQGVFDARTFLLALADRARALGAQIFEETRVTAVDTGDRVVLRASHGTVTAGRLVLATGLFPPPYRSLNALFTQSVTFAVALAQTSSWRLPNALYWDVAQPFHYLRFLDDQLLLGGEDRPLNEARATGERAWQALSSFARAFVPDARAEVTHQWRGLILETADGLPVVGTPEDGDPRILLLSGFGGNGMTFGVRGGKFAAELLAGALSPHENPCRFGRATLSKATG